ncbi:unnamed protein product [Boreogadus saida]
MRTLLEVPSRSCHLLHYLDVQVRRRDRHYHFAPHLCLSAENREYIKMTSTKRISQASGSGEALDKRPSSGSPESAPGARSFSGPLCASCPASLAPGDGHLVCFRCLGSDHTAAAMAAPVSCVACRELPEEGILSRHLFFSPSVNLAEAIDLFRAGAPDLDDDGGIIDVDNLGFCQAGL